MVSRALGFRSQSTIAMAVLSVVLCFIPLFNLLAFEFCFVSAMGLTAVFGFESARTVNAQESIFRSWQRSSYRLVGPLTALLLPIVLNGLRVQNCNWIEGFRIFGLFVILGGVVAAGLGSLFGRFNRSGHWLYLLFWLLCLGSGVARFYFTPQVDIFSLFGGYFPGAIYDEVVQEETRILWSRIEDLSLTGFVLVVATFVRQETQLRTVLLATLCLLLSVYQGERMDLRRSATHVQARLGGHLSTPNFEIYYPKQWSADRVASLAVELAFLHKEVSQTLNTKPAAPFGIYFYNNMNQKKRLMGARNTRIAKPWQREFHIDAPRIGSSVIRHELIHLFAADFGARPLSIAQNKFGLPNMALTEGLAEAFSPRDERLSLHEWTAALDRIDKRPKIEALLSADGFYQSSARTAYTVCGSLILYTYERYGLEPIKTWYREGAWQQTPPLSTLIADWQTYLDSIDLKADAVEAARAYFDRPSIFKRVCAHEISALRERVRQEIRAREYERAIETLDMLLSFNPNNGWARLTRLEQLAVMGRFQDALKEAEYIATETSFGRVTRDLAKEWVADIQLLSGKFEAAQSIYRTLREQAFNRNLQRRLDVKLIGSQRPHIGQALVRFLSFSRTRERATHQIESLYREDPKNPIIIYLRARHLISKNQPLLAVQHLSAIQEIFPYPSLQLEIARLLAMTSFNKHCYASAARRYRNLIERFRDELTLGEQQRFETWVRRSTFFAESPRLKTLSCPLEIDNPGKPPHDGGKWE